MKNKVNSEIIFGAKSLKCILYDSLFSKSHWLARTVTSRHNSPRWFCFHAWHLIRCRLNQIFLAFLQIQDLVRAELELKQVTFAMHRLLHLYENSVPERSNVISNNC